MKALRILARNLRDSFKSIFRNFALSLASISCITITLIVVSLAIILTFNVNNFATSIEKDVTIVAFLDVDITQEDTDKVESEIKKLDNIESYVYRSKKEITDEMMESSDVFKSIMSEWSEEENPLQATFQVKVVDIETIGDVANKIKAIEHVSTVKYGEGMVEQLVSIFDSVKKASLLVVIALILVTAFLISNTIKITIFSRKREIEIMRLVGASNINIKIPFIFEGLFLGLFGSIIPVAATIYGYSTVYDKLGGQLFTKIITLIKPSPFMFWLSLLLVVIGMVVGMFGSVRAVRKHLKI